MTTTTVATQRSGLARSADGIVVLNNVVKTYKEGDIEVAAIRGISMSIPHGSFSLIVGPSGSGKTTLLNLISAIDLPDAGNLVIDGVETTTMQDRELTALRAQKIGFIFQNFNLIPVLSAAENVEFALLESAMSRAERQDAVAETLAAVGLQDRSRQRPNQLSGGQRQRVAIARSLVKKPAIILADEPTANLNSVTGKSIVTLMRQIQDQFATTFIVSTHNPGLMPMADRTYTIDDGLLVD